MADENTTDDLFDDGEAAGSDAGSEDTTSAPPADTKAPQSTENSDKRVNDLMSKWQSAEAKIKRLEARLNSQTDEASNGGDGQPVATSNPATDEFLEIAREQARTSLFTSDPRFAKYGFEVTAIEGKTAAEMRASADKLRAIVDKVEGSARSDALREHGLVPEMSGGPGSEKPVDFSAMSDKEILELADRAMGRR